ncbi:serine protease 3-like [Drosophila innubila]|uniref:serine protease 3-like n=1 Tax=Drosophila innubila TaxID=198719 RepID=UPI00148B8B37|nr:serine protease 3-like [Drosophila innubila]
MIHSSFNRSVINMKLIGILFLAIATVTASSSLGKQQVAPVRTVEERIINGQPAAEGQFPYQVGLSLTSLSTRENYFCGGVIIGTEWLLTAAHCTADASGVLVYYGSTERKSAKLYQYVPKTKFIEHPDYSYSPLTNDIALINTPVLTFNEYYNKIELPSISSRYSSYAGQQAIASGWGYTSQWVYDISDTLQYTTLDIISVEACESIYGDVVASSKVICVATTNKKTTCSGDSGGPLVLLSTGKLIGVTSFSSIYGCEYGDPAGFSRITSYLGWIKESTGIYY